MNLNAACKDILEVCTCSSLYVCLLLVVLRITCSAESGEHRMEPIEPKIPTFIPLQMVLQLLMSVLAQRAVVGLGRGTSIPLIWGLLGALVVQALLPSEVCQAPGTGFTVVLKENPQPTHFKSPWRWLPPVSKSRQEHLWMICFLALWSFRLPYPVHKLKWHKPSVNGIQWTCNNYFAS